MVMMKTMSTANDLTSMSKKTLIEMANGLASRQAYCLNQAEAAMNPTDRKYWQDARRTAQLDLEAVDAEFSRRK